MRSWIGLKHIRAQVPPLLRYWEEDDRWKQDPRRLAQTQLRNEIHAIARKAIKLAGLKKDAMNKLYFAYDELYLRHKAAVRTECL